MKQDLYLTYILIFSCMNLSGNLEETILTFDYTDGLLQEVNLYMSYPLNFHTEAMMGHLLGKQSTLMCNNMKPKGNDSEKWYYHYRTDPTTGQLISITQSGEIERTVDIEIKQNL